MSFQDRMDGANLSARVLSYAFTRLTIQAGWNGMGNPPWVEATRKELSEMAGISLRSVQRGIAELEERGVLEIDREPAGANLYRVYHQYDGLAPIAAALEAIESAIISFENEDLDMWELVLVRRRIEEITGA